MVVVADRDHAGAQAVAAQIGGTAVGVDVTVEADVSDMVAQTIAAHGAVDVYCSNAGVALAGGPEAPDDAWRASWEVHVMAHVYAARALLPSMLERGEGCIVGTVSAAGLLNHLAAAPYAVTKAAALSFLEWLSIAYGDRGVRVSALCPQGVRTPMLAQAGEGDFLAADALEPDQVAAAVIAALRVEEFLILPHPEVRQYFVRRATDHDRWLRGMRRLRARVMPR
jgi:NAD(P)-dependent dehydrogenase (short-subunit alcohol dehydrogenase family)